MANLLWFHSFDRKNASNEVESIVDVLKNGPTFHPDPKSKTRVHEGRLSITPSRVYAYLGRAHDHFGLNAIVLPSGALSDGDMSPFDSGGLVDRIQPVNGYDDTAKAAYLALFTFKFEKREELIETYPKTDPTNLSAYLDGKKPSAFKGPHDAFPQENSQAVALWEQNSDWRTWTWEGRATSALPVANLVAWTCPTAMRPSIMRAAAAKHAADAAWLDKISKSYKHGGMSLLISELREIQAA